MDHQDEPHWQGDKLSVKRVYSPSLGESGIVVTVDEDIQVCEVHWPPDQNGKPKDIPTVVPCETLSDVEPNDPFTMEEALTHEWRDLREWAVKKASRT